MEENFRKIKKSQFISRRYDENYLKFGFCAFNSGDHNNLVYGELFANESLKPSKLKAFRYKTSKFKRKTDRVLLQPNFHKNQKIIKKNIHQFRSRL